MVTYDIKAVIKFSENNIVSYKNEDIVKFTRGNRTSSNNSALVIGVIARYGNLIIKDKNSYILGLANANLINNNIIIQIYRGKQLIGEYSTTKNWKYDYIKNEVDIELKSRILQWSNTFIQNGVPYTEDVDGWYALSYLMGISIGENELSTNVFENISNDVSSYLSNIHFNKLYIKPDYLDRLWQKFCNFALLKVFENDNGKIQIERV